MDTNYSRRTLLVRKRSPNIESIQVTWGAEVNVTIIFDIASVKRAIVGDPAREACEALDRHIAAYGDFFCWVPDAAARQLSLLARLRQDRRFAASRMTAPKVADRVRNCRPS